MAGKSGLSRLFVTSDDPLEELGYPNRATLRLVLALHAIESLAQVVLIGSLVLVGLALPYGSLLVVVLAYALWNTGSWLALRRVVADADCSAALTLQLVVETLALTLLLYFTGGATNPFVSLFLVPMAVAALCLPLLRASVIALLAAIAYTALLFLFQPLAAQHVHDAAAFNFHVLGMWLNFLASGILLLVFIGLLARIARQRAARLNLLREQYLRDEQVVAMGGVAAGAAHSLATPLSTIGVVLDELAENPAQVDATLVETAREQLAVCRTRLAEVLQATHSGREGNTASPLREALEVLARQWHRMRPEVDLRVDNQLPERVVSLDPAVRHGILTLLDNAADANSQRGGNRVALCLSMQDDNLRVTVADEGGGPVPRLRAEAVRSSKPDGAGMGLLILRSNLDRLGGSLQFEADHRGTLALLLAPVLTTEPP
ncbi:MAG: HAMP domain-containing histidine kinase [Pseudomonadales bacterium]|nr:HAMP domain-containing histidine kinase [Pseudomonadales bacterium]MCP5184409.1 HAMP domain-containing histidine kinase [Pseudomonadales bacterium]